jgi:hypothetical protein
VAIAHGAGLMLVPIHFAPRRLELEYPCANDVFEKS